VATRLNQVIAKLLKTYRIEKPVQQHQALFEWRNIVGDEIARHTQPEKISYGKLVVKVDSPVWRNELIFSKEEILKKINQKLKKAKIKEIVLR